MANIISYASGNITGTTTFKNAGTGTNAFKWTTSTSNVTNTTASDVYNGNTEDFTVTNLEVIEGLLLFCKQVTTTGTVTVTLSDDSGTTATRTVTVNATDLPTAYAPVFFKFGSTLTADGGSDYAVAIKGSSAGNASFVRASATAADWAHGLRTNTTSTPAAADALYIVGEWTGAAAGSTYTVTMNDTASTDWGTIDIGQNGVLTSGTAAATNYTLKHSGDLNVWGAGTYSIGTTGTPIPRGSTYTQTMDCTTNVEFGMKINDGGTFNSQGLSRTSGKDIYYCKLNTDEAANSTSLGVDTDTGWLDNDEIAVASTTRTASQCEAGALNGNAGASSLTVDGFGGTGGGLANAHDGTSPVQAEVILLTRSIKIQGASNSLQGYIDFVFGGGASTVDIDWTEIKWMGSATTGKRGIDIQSSGSTNIQYSSLHDFTVASSLALNMGAGSPGTLTFSNNVTWNNVAVHAAVAQTSATWTMDSNIFMRNTNTAAALVDLSDVGGTFTNNTVAGCACTSSTTGAFQLTETATATYNQLGTFNNITSHSNAGLGVLIGSIAGGTITTLTSWRNSSTGLYFTNAQRDSLVLDSVTLFGNSGQNINCIGNVGKLIFISLISNGDSTFSTTSGIVGTTTPSSLGDIFIYSGDFSTVSGIKTAHTNDISFSQPNYTRVVFNNTILGGSTEVSAQTNMTPTSFIGSQKHDQTAGNHKTWKKYGTITTDTTISRTNSPSERLTPNNASNKLISGTRQVAVASGSALTPSVYVRESEAGDGTAYNGNRVRLIVKRNDAIGITSDTVLDTATAASDGAFEQLTGTTATATDDGVMEFYVDCDGTTGWINVDDWTVS